MYVCPCVAVCGVFCFRIGIDGFAVFRRPPPAAPDPSLSADRHVPDTGRLVVSLVLTRLNYGDSVLWPSGLLGPTTPVSAERGCAVNLSPAAIRPHLRRAGLHPLAARALQ